MNLQMSKNEFSSRRNWIENYYNKTLLRIQFTLEFYVHRWRLYKKNKSMIPFYGQDCAITSLSYMALWNIELFCSTSLLPNVRLMLDYLKSFFSIFFALNEKKNSNKTVWETESFIPKLKSTFSCFEFLIVCIIYLYTKLGLYCNE